MKVVVRRNFTSRLKAAGRSVRCDAFRSGELDHERLGVFSRDSDNADVAGFIRSLDDPLTRDRETRRGTHTPAKLYRMVFSLHQDHWDASGLTSWRPIIRAAVTEFERQRGIRLEGRPPST